MPRSSQIMPCSPQIMWDATWNSCSGEVLFSQAYNSSSNINNFFCPWIPWFQRIFLQTSVRLYVRWSQADKACACMSKMNGQNPKEKQTLMTSCLLPWSRRYLPNRATLQRKKLSKLQGPSMLSDSPVMVCAYYQSNFYRLEDYLVIDRFCFSLFFMGHHMGS